MGSPKTARTVVLRRVRLRNYKSISFCALDLSPITFLVGRNGSGKSNFLDAIRFVVEALEASLDHAITSRGGVDAVRRRSTGHPRNFSIEMELDLQNGNFAEYGFEIGSHPQGGFAVKWERLSMVDAHQRELDGFHRIGDEIKHCSWENPSPMVEDRLFLVAAAGLPAIRPVYDVITSMGFYNPNPETIRELHSPDAGELLKRDGSNLSSVLRRMPPEKKARIEEFLGTIVPGITGVDCKRLGPKETVEFRQDVEGSKFPWHFFGTSMSDGTLRAVALLVAVSQVASSARPVRLVGIEEPETAMHPAAVAALMDALREAAVTTQILITTHSADLLDQVQFEQDQLLVVQSTASKTEIGAVDEASCESIKNHLFTVGELLRLGQLDIDQVDVQRQRELFPALDD